MTAPSNVEVFPEGHPEAVPLASTSPALAEADTAQFRAVNRRLAINAAAGGGANAVKIAIQVVMLPTMAHLLGPAEFGLYALALPTVAFFVALADGGLGASLAREDETNAVVWSTAFWLLLAIGVVLALVVSGWGVGLAVLVHEKRLQGLMVFLSISILLITASVLPAARLTRQGRLVVISGADLLSTVIGSVVAIALAAGGAGAWSLAAQYVVGFLVRAVTLNFAAFRRPSWLFDLAALRHHISMGSSLLGGRLCDFAGRMTENLLFGRTFGAASLGAFTFANQAPRFICEAASSPIWAALYAHALRERQDRIGLLHAKLVRLLAMTVFPVVFLISAAAPQVLALILGPRWESTAVLLRILIPCYGLNVAAGQSGAVLLAGGRGWLLFKLTLGLTAGRILAVALGPWVGSVGVAFGIGLAQIVYSIVMFCAPGWAAGYSIAPLLRGLVAPSIASVFCAAVCYALISIEPESNLILAASLIAGVASYLIFMFVLDGKQMRCDVKALLALARDRNHK